MNKNYDELYNKFIDNELSNEEIEKIKSLAKADKKFNKELKIHKFVHNSLFELPLVKAPFDITTKVMEQIVNSIAEKYKKNYFFRVILAIFGIIFLITIIMIFQSTENIQNDSSTILLFEYFKPYIQNIISQINSLFNSNFLKTMIGLFSLIVLLFFYFTIDDHKKFKKKLNQY